MKLSKKMSLSNLKFYFNFILSGILRDFSIANSKSMLGTLWLILNPLVQIFIYIFIFSKIINIKFPELVNNKYAYSINLCAGIILWNLFSELSKKLINFFSEYSYIIKKISINKALLIIISCGVPIINFFISLLIFLVFLIFIKSFLFFNIFYFIQIFIMTVIFSISVGFFLGLINVFFRDIYYIYNIFLSLLFWLTPIVYPISLVPERFIFIFEYNPLAILILSFQNLFLKTESAFNLNLLLFIFFNIFLILTSILFYKYNKNRIYDEI